MRHHSEFGPRALTCDAVLRKDRSIVDPSTKQSGRCGRCQKCWRLFKFALRTAGRPLPKPGPTGAIAGFTFANNTRRPREASE